MLNVGVLESADRLRTSLAWASISYEFTNYCYNLCIIFYSHSIQMKFLARVQTDAR